MAPTNDCLQNQITNVLTAYMASANDGCSFLSTGNKVDLFEAIRNPTWIQKCSDTQLQTILEIIATASRTTALRSAQAQGRITREIADRERRAREEREREEAARIERKRMEAIQRQ